MQTRNLLLDSLPAADLERLRPRLEELPLELKQRLHEQDERVTDIYFPVVGMISQVTELADGTIIETGTIGHEGVTGIPAALFGGRSPSRVLCQIPGHAFRLSRAVLDDELHRPDSALLGVCHRYTNFLVAMLAQTAACNRTHDAPSRMARWLLMTRDRVDSDDFPLTQEFLAQMLGLQRPTVNLAATALQRAGLIEYTRGRIRIVDRPQLETVACDCYAHLNVHLRALHGEDEWRR